MATVETPHEMTLPTAIPVRQDSKLDIMALTMAALRLVSPWTAQQSVECDIKDPKERVITLDEVANHDSYDDCWVVIYDRVYDISTFQDEHPGGGEIMMEYAGRDASTAFRSSGHSRMAIKALDRFLVGELPIHECMYRRPGGIRLSDIPD